MIEISFEASDRFCSTCTQDDVVGLINSALYRLKCYETRSRSVHIVNIALYEVKAGGSIAVGDATPKCALIVRGRGSLNALPIVPGLFLVYNEPLTVKADEDVALYEGAVEFL